jgi:hypothetical protein
MSPYLLYHQTLAPTSKKICAPGGFFSLFDSNIYRGRHYHPPLKSRLQARARNPKSETTNQKYPNAHNTTRQYRTHSFTNSLIHEHFLQGPALFKSQIAKKPAFSKVFKAFQSKLFMPNHHSIQYSATSNVPARIKPNETK